MMDKRAFLIGTGGFVAAAGTLGCNLGEAAEVNECGRVAEPATFVLVPGGHSGGWVFAEVAGMLRDRGHRVFTPIR